MAENPVHETPSSTMATQASSVTTETASSQGCLLFSPTADQARLSAALEDIPRYLFRVHAPKTAGQTTNKEVISRAAMLGKPGATTDILSMPARSAAEMLNSHLRGWSRDGDNLMSWSSSLLFALQYALYRNIKERDRDELADIRVHVLDTSGLPPGALLPDAPLLDAFADKDSWKTYNLAKIRSLRRDTSYNFGKYLSQGTLSIEGRSTSTSLQEIINHGLFKLCPEMGEPNEKPELAKRVCRLRADCFATSVATSKLEIRIALSLAEGCFGDEWALPMMAALLSLRRRRRNDSVIVDAFSANFSEKELRKHDLGALKSFSNEKLPEVYQFEKIIQDIHSYHCTRALDSVIATTMRLSLSSQSPLKPKEHVTYIDVGDEVWEV